jgi:hypothetical protein
MTLRLCSHGIKLIHRPDQAMAIKMRGTPCLAGLWKQA